MSVLVITPIVRSIATDFGFSAAVMIWFVVALFWFAVAPRCMTPAQNDPAMAAVMGLPVSMVAAVVHSVAATMVAMKMSGC